MLVTRSNGLSVCFLVGLLYASFLLAEEHGSGQEGRRRFAPREGGRYSLLPERSQQQKWLCYLLNSTLFHETRSEKPSFFCITR